MFVLSYAKAMIFGKEKAEGVKPPTAGHCMCTHAPHRCFYCASLSILNQSQPRQRTST